MLRVLRGVDPALDQEAIRVVQSSPKWTPAKQRDKGGARIIQLPYRIPAEKLNQFTGKIM